MQISGVSVDMKQKLHKLISHSFLFAQYLVKPPIIRFLDLIKQPKRI